MSDGWETRRRRGPGTTGRSCGWDARVRSGASRWTRRTSRATPRAAARSRSPNAPDAEAQMLAESAMRGASFSANASRSRNTLHRFEEELERPGRGDARAPEHLSRRRRQPFEALCPAHAVSGLAAVNAMAEEGSQRRDARMLRFEALGTKDGAGTTFLGEADLIANADRIWSELSEEDWLEAFAAHPRIGARASGQAAAEAGPAPAAPRRRRSRPSPMPTANTRIASATSSSCAPRAGAPRKCSTLCRRRLHNAPAEELKVAAEEQRKITRLRLLNDDRGFMSVVTTHVLDTSRGKPAGGVPVNPRGPVGRRRLESHRQGSDGRGRPRRDARERGFGSARRLSCCPSPPPRISAP